MNERTPDTSSLTRQGMDYGETSDVQEVHAAIQREKREPRVGLEPLSIWLIAVYGLAIFLGGAYVGRYSGSFSGAELFQTIAKLFPLLAISRCVPADCDRSLVQLPLPASWLELESACPLSRPRGRHPLRCDPPTSEN